MGRWTLFFNDAQMNSSYSLEPQSKKKCGKIISVKYIQNVRLAKAHKHTLTFSVSAFPCSELQPEPWGVPRLPEWEGVRRGGISPGVSAGGGGDRYRSGPLSVLHHHHCWQPAQRQPTSKSTPSSQLRSVRDMTIDSLTCLTSGSRNNEAFDSQSTKWIIKSALGWLTSR